MSDSPSTPTSSAGPSTLRSRSARPPSLTTHDNSNSHDRQPSTTPGTPREPATSNSAGSNESKDKQLPGGLWLPAVKGTIGGIESPRRHMRSSPSISTLRGETPSSSSSFPPDSASTVQPQTHQPEEQVPPASRAVFRGDPTVRSCILGLKMDGKDEIARLFGVA